MNVTYKSDRIFQTICHIVLVIFSFVCLFPFVLMLISSFSSEASITKYGYSIFPREWSLEAYVYIAREWRQIGQAYTTTIGVTLIGTLFGVFMTMTLAYLLSRRDLPGRKFLNIFVIVTMLYNGGLVHKLFPYQKYLYGITDTKSNAECFLHYDHQELYTVQYTGRACRGMPDRWCIGNKDILENGIAVIETYFCNTGSVYRYRILE